MFFFFVEKEIAPLTKSLPFTPVPLSNRILETFWNHFLEKKILGKVCSVEGSSVFLSMIPLFYFLQKNKMVDMSGLERPKQKAAL